MHFISINPAYNDTIDSLKNEFNNDTSNTLVICGAHELSKKHSIYEYKAKYDKVIVFNQEPLLATQRQFMHFDYFAFMKGADEVWDYDEANVNVLKNWFSNVKLHLLKPYKQWSIYQPVHKDIDILFYGSMNKHREIVLNQLAKQCNVKILYNVFDLDSYILRSKILLNIHYYYECSMQEQARMIRWIGAPSNIISERSRRNYLDVYEVNYNNIVEACVKNLQQ